MSAPQLFRSPIVVIDTETTGFDTSWAEVIEIAMVLLDTEGTEIDHYASLVRPDVLDERADGALAVNHITREMLAGQPTPHMVAQTARGWLSTHGDPYLTAFNVGFDRRFVEKLGLRGYRWASCVMLRAMPLMGSYGALKQSRWGKPQWPKLSAAAEFFGVRVDGDPHRALTDARTAAQVAVEIRRRELDSEAR